MGSVLQRVSRQGSDGFLSSSLITNPISLSSPSMLQENRSASFAESTDGYVQQGHRAAPTCVQSSALSFPPECLSDLSPEQRARMEYYKSIALARRKEKLKQQNQDEELLSNRLTPLQSTPAFQQSNPVQSTLSSQQAETYLWGTAPLRQADYGGISLVSTGSSSSPSSQQDIYQGPALAHIGSHTPPSHQRSHAGLACTQSAQFNYGAPDLTSMHSARDLQCGSPYLHRSMYRSSTHSAQSSQEGKCTTLSSVQISALLQKSNQDGLAPTYVQNPLLLSQGSHSGLALDSVHGPLTLQQQVGHSNSPGSSSHGFVTLQHDGCVGSSLTLEQRARMAREREKALAKLKGRQKQEHCFNETGTSQCSRADGLSKKTCQVDNGSPLTPVQIAYKSQEEEAATGGKMMETRNFSTETFFQHSQVGYTRNLSNYVQNSQHSALPLTSGQSIASSEQVTCWGSSLTPEQRAHMAHQKEMAIARRKARLGWQRQHQQQQDDHHSHLTYAHCLDPSQQDTHCGSSLTQEHRARMAYQKELARFKRNARLQQQQEHYEHGLTQLADAQSLALSQQDTYSGSSLTQEQRTRMSDQKEMAIARRNARLQQQQQDEHHHVHHNINCQTVNRGKTWNL